MTGRELRAHLAANGITPNQFYERVADISEAAGTASRSSAIRAAKRWLSEQKLDAPLALRPHNAEAAAMVAGLPPTALEAPARESAPDRLEQLAAAFAKTTKEQTAIAKQVRRLQVRVRQLEARPSPGATQTKGQGGSV